MATTRTSYGRDLGLQARMLLTMLMLGLLYLGLVGVPCGPASARS